MADLDTELGSRLARLAESVPVAPWLGHVEPSSVAARRQIRMAWLTPLVALAVVVVGIAVFGRPAEPGATDAPGGVVSRAAQGPFVLELRSTKARYGPDEPIEMAASLTYVGDEPQVRINHSLGPQDGPIAFGTLEPVIASHRLGTVWSNACHGTELRQGEPLTIPFTKGGFVISADEPGAGEFMHYLQDPVLRLPVGTWHPHAVAEFSIGGCGSDETFMLRATIEIVVTAEAIASSGASESLEPTAPASPTVKPSLEETPIRLETRDLPRSSDGRTICMTALAHGTLARTPRTGLGLRLSGRTADVIWPTGGYTAVERDGVAVLLDGSGTEIAREGDVVAIGGGAWPDGSWIACGVSKVATPSPPTR